MTQQENIALMPIINSAAVPLYCQIKEWLVARINTGEWQPGELIPSEMYLAKELNVSQGTVRKAISELVEHNVFTRKQGKGTFVANHDTQRELFHFLNIADNNGEKVVPDSVVLSCRQKRATRSESEKLHLAAESKVVCIERIRSFNKHATILEYIVLASESFDGLAALKTDDIPNTLYALYEKQYGITVHRAKEKLRAVTASNHEAQTLNVAKGTPLLEVERLALALDGRPVELRISRCKTEKFHYQNTIL